MKNLYPGFENIRSVGNAYRVLGITSWPDLPETLSEVNSIKKMIHKSNIFTGKNVTEKDIKELSDDWKFYDYKVLHFEREEKVEINGPVRIGESVGEEDSINPS